MTVDRKESKTQHMHFKLIFQLILVHFIEYAPCFGTQIFSRLYEGCSKANRGTALWTCIKQA